MSIAEIVILGVAFSMDAFAVAICKGLSLQKLKTRHSLIVGAYFGIFQAVMPALGYLLAFRFEAMINSFSHWIAFLLLTLIGSNMIYESFSQQEESCNSYLGFRTMFPLAIATSIDALVGGVSFAFAGMQPHQLLIAVASIGLMTFTFSALGVKIGHTFGAKYKNKAELAGGIALILIGINIVLNRYGLGSQALFDFIKGLF